MRKPGWKFLFALEPTCRRRSALQCCPAAVRGRRPAGDHPHRPDLNECLAYADVSRPEIRALEIDVEIENQQLILDRSETRPRVEAFTGYEVYSESDPLVGPEFNHGYIVGINATWHIFDGFATRGRMQATRARRDAALHALETARRSVAADVRSAFLDLQQADRLLESETRNVQNADESLEIAKGNPGAGLAHSSIFFRPLPT